MLTKRWQLSLVKRTGIPPNNTIQARISFAANSDNIDAIPSLKDALSLVKYGIPFPP